MKTRTLFLFLLFYSICVYGQDTAVSSDTVPQVRKNVVKFLPVNLAFNNLPFEYKIK